MGPATCGSTTPIPRRKKSSTSRRSRPTCDGSASSGRTSFTPPTTSSGCTRSPSSSIVDGKAYVDSLSADEIREYRGTLTAPGRNSPYRDRPAADSLDLFRRMRAGEFPDGAYVLRAKIDMSSPNINLRDPVLYRIRRIEHHRTGDSVGDLSRPTTTRIRCPTRSRASRTRSAPSSSRIIARSTTG